MKQSSADIGEVLKDRLQQCSATVSFDSVWNKHERENTRHFKLRKAAVIPMIALITLLTAFTVGFAAYGILTVDNTDYPYVEDQSVIGKWQSVDFVGKIEQFETDQKAFEGELYLTELAFNDGGDMLASFEGGNLAYTTLSWTKGLILNKQEKTASKYEIKEIDGQTYMFFEWKSGDYTFRGLNPKYYVMKKVDSNDYANIDIPRKEDKIDYPFSDNPEMLGSWQSVDFVKDIDDFEPGVMSWLGGLYLTELNISENGELAVSTTSWSGSSDVITWTGDLIIHKNDKTASKCIIKEIDGATYMFFEWKNGDYTYRGAEPWYYVLKKVE